MKNIINRLKSKFTKKPKFEGINNPIQFAFSCGGIDYYEFVDAFNLPAHRGMQLMVELDLMRSKVNEDYLKKHTQAVDAVLLNPSKIDVFKIKQINDQLKERLNFIAFDIDSLYKVAAVHFFDKTEHPEIYDKKYAVKKIELWRKNADIEDFFLQQPLVRLFPFLENQQENLKNYQEVVNKLNHLHLENLSVGTLKK